MRPDRIDYAATRYSEDARGQKHAPAGSGKGGQFVADDIDRGAVSKGKEGSNSEVDDLLNGSGFEWQRSGGQLWAKRGEEWEKLPDDAGSVWNWLSKES